ncbi:hypothetical protein D9M69_579220 [compost metagenome]
MAQIKTQVDAVGALHAQAQRGQAGGLFQRLHGRFHGRGVSPGHDEPEVEVVLARVVVVHARVGRHGGRDLVQAVVGHRHRRQQGRTAGPGREHAADAADRARALQALAGREHVRLAQVQRLGDVGKGFPHQRKAVLPGVEQSQVARAQRGGNSVACAHGFKSPPARRAR